MSDDRLSPASNREMFEAIVSRLVDPELVRLRRILLVLGVTLYLVGAVVVWVVAGLRWPGLIAFSSTFVPGVLLARTLQGRRFRPDGRRALR